jgi:hypothetical protein
VLKVRHLSQVFFADPPRAMNRSGVSRRVLTLWSAVHIENAVLVFDGIFLECVGKDMLMELKMVIIVPAIDKTTGTETL